MLRLFSLDTNAASMLQFIPGLRNSTSTAIVRRQRDAGVRVAAVKNLGDLLDSLIAAKMSCLLPKGSELSQLLAEIHATESNPCMFQATIRTSEPIMATFALHHEQEAARDALD